MTCYFRVSPVPVCPVKSSGPRQLLQGLAVPETPLVPLAHHPEGRWVRTWPLPEEGPIPIYQRADREPGAGSYSLAKALPALPRHSLLQGVGTELAGFLLQQQQCMSLQGHIRGGEKIWPCTDHGGDSDSDQQEVSPSVGLVWEFWWP